MLKAVNIAGLALVVLWLANAPALAGECKWATEDEVKQGCKADCAHFARDKETCVSICDKMPMKRYLAWTDKKCTSAARKKCHQDLASHLDSISVDQSIATAYEAVIYYGCEGNKLPEGGSKP